MTSSNFANQRASVIHLPAGGPTGERRDISASFEAFENRHLSLGATEPVPLSTIVSVEYDDAMFLGEVIACFSDAENHWKLEVKVEQVLNGLQSLMRLRSSLLGEPAPSLNETLRSSKVIH